MVEGAGTEVELRRRLADIEAQLAEAREALEAIRSGAVDAQAAEEAVRRSEQRYRAVANCTYDWEDWVDSSGRPTWISPSVERMTGYSVQECLAMPDYPLPLIHEDDRAVVSAYHREAVAGETFNDRPFRVRRKDGSVRWVAISAQPIRDDRGVRVGHRSNIRDITDRKRAEDELRRTKDYLQSILKSSPDMIISVDGDRRVVAFNRAAEVLLGYSAAEAIGQPVQMLYADPQEAERVYGSMKGTGRFRGEIVNRAKSGATFVSHLEASSLRDEQGRVCGVMGISRDVTEQKRAEAERAALAARMERSHEDLLSILNQLRQGIIMTDREGRITFVSPSCQRLLGGNAEAVCGTPWTGLRAFEPADKAALEGMARRGSDERKKVPVRMHSAQGQRFSVEVEILDDPRDAERKIFFIYDVTEVHDLRFMLDEKRVFHGLVGQSRGIRQVVQQIRDLASADVTVLIEGETGTGKELVAQAIHAAGSRPSKLFLPVNCAGLTESLIGSQLFGHKRGAFTGAFADHRGVFETAHGGTVFLDEIGDLPMSMQTNLLRVLQEREITRLGESVPRRVDVRVIAATHHSLDRLVQEGKFRTDLLYRIRVARIAIPPLRERRDDIPLLAELFLSEATKRNKKVVTSVSDEAMRRMLEYDWPGNVRELQSAIEFACISCRGSVIQADALPPELSVPAVAPRLTASFGADARDRLLAAIHAAKGSRTTAARLLGVSRATLYRRLRDMHLDPGTLP